MSRYSESLTKVREAIEAEKAAGDYQITSIDRKFYHDVRNILEGQEPDSEEYNKLESMMYELYRMRVHNIMIFASVNDHNDPLLWNKLADEESDFFHTINKAGLRLDLMVRKGIDRENQSE